MNQLIRYSNWSSVSRLPIVILFCLTVIFGIKLGDLGINASPYIVEQAHPLRQSQRDLEEIFSNTGEQVMVVLDVGEGLFEADSLSKIADLTEAFETISLTDETDSETLSLLGEKHQWSSQVEGIIEDGINLYDLGALNLLLKQLKGGAPLSEINVLKQVIVRANPVFKVRSLTTVENLTDQDGFLEAGKLVQQNPDNSLEAAELKDAARENELYQKILIDTEAQVTNVQIELNITSDDSPNMILIYAAILDVIEQQGYADRVHLTGIPVVNAQIGQVMDNDNKQFFPFVILSILLVLYFTFRQVLIVFTSLSVAVLTMVWTLGTMTLFGIQQNIVTAILPIFLISIAVADSIHYISAYLFKMKEGAEKAISATNDHLMRPMLLTTITTVFGFLALSYSDLVFIREFGIFVALGVIYAFFITVTLLPYVLPRLKKPKRKTLDTQSVDRFSQLTIRVFQWTQSNIKVFSSIVVALLCLVIFQATQITVDNHSTASFDESSTIRLDEKFIKQKIGGIYPVNFWLEGTEDRSVLRPDVVLLMEKLQQHINQYPQVGYSISPNDFLKRINKVAVTKEYALPSPLNQSTVSQLFLLYENSNGQDLKDVTDFNYQNGRIVALFNTDQATKFSEVIDGVRALADANLPSDIKLNITGYGAEIVLATELVVFGQITSILISIILVGGLMMLYYRSFLLGLIGILPLTLTIIINFGLMSLTKVPLDIGTALISGIAFGVGIDYAIHLISIFQSEQQRRDSTNVALKATLESVARPIIVNSVSLGLGFLILGLSDFASLRQLGYFISVSMVICAILTLVILPLILGRVASGAKSPTLENTEGLAAN